MELLTRAEQERAGPVVMHDKRAEGRLKAVDDLLDTLSQEAARRRKRRRFFKWLAAGIVVAVALSALILDGTLKVKIGYYWLTAASVCLFEILATRKERKTARTLSELDDPRAIGPLVEALELQGDAFTDGRTMDAVKEALGRLLPNESAQLTPHQLNILAEYALVDEDSPLVIGALKALQRHAHTEVMDSVEGLTGASYLSVRAEAQTCLEALRAEDIRQKQYSTLLRPSERVPDGSLLRAAAATPESESQLLLRPSAEA